MNESYREERVEVRAYFKEGGKVVTTERCSSVSEAKVYAKYLLNYYPYVEIVYQSGVLHPFDIYEERSSEVLYRFKL